MKRARELELSLKDVQSLVSVADASGCPSTHSSYRKILHAHLRRLDARINHLLARRELQNYIDEIAALTLPRTASREGAPAESHARTHK